MFKNLKKLLQIFYSDVFKNFFYDFSKQRKNNKINIFYLQKIWGPSRFFSPLGISSGFLLLLRTLKKCQDFKNFICNGRFKNHHKVRSKFKWTEVRILDARTKCFMYVYLKIFTPCNTVCTRENELGKNICLIVYPRYS